ncbi:hypothetical protein BKA70DRAFT_1222799 [Coprinopsis sp. MPI-PUGE-AT-0042]|nr:hypothetical protein BKA70DRAFT_1222799 [Coprinopsis sp. MPI-PUGE-AT-0042]
MAIPHWFLEALLSTLHLPFLALMIAQFKVDYQGAQAHLGLIQCSAPMAVLAPSFLFYHGPPRRAAQCVCPLLAADGREVNTRTIIALGAVPELVEPPPCRTNTMKHAVNQGHPCSPLSQFGSLPCGHQYQSQWHFSDKIRLNSGKRK